MTLRTIQFLALLLTALAFVPGGAHLAALLNKIGLDQNDYFTVQQIYRGWALFGSVLIGALVANLALTIALRRARRPFGWALASLVLVVANLVIFFTWTFPTNQATRNWTVMPENWAQLRAQWEYSHALNAAVMLAALVCVILSVLSRADESQARQGHHRGEAP